MEESKISKFKMTTLMILGLLANLIISAVILYFSWSWLIEFVKDIWNSIF